MPSKAWYLEGDALIEPPVSCPLLPRAHKVIYTVKAAAPRGVVESPAGMILKTEAGAD